MQNVHYLFNYHVYHSILCTKITFSPQWTQIQPADEDTRLSSISSTQDAEGATTHATPQQSGKMLTKPIVFSPGARDGKRKKLELREVFNPDEDDAAAVPQRKRKLVPLGRLYPHLVVGRMLQG